jgi:hypothetical protein
MAFTMQSWSINSKAKSLWQEEHALCLVETINTQLYRQQMIYLIEKMTGMDQKMVK